MNSVFKTPLKLFTCLNCLDEEEKPNLIPAARYLLKEGIELTDENIVKYAREDVFKSKVKKDKEFKSVSKKLNELIIDFYS